MNTFARFTVLTFACSLFAVVVPPSAIAQRGTAPDIKNPGVETGTGVDRNGIKSNSRGPRRTTNFVLPSGGYYYGYSQGPYYYSDRYYDNYPAYGCGYCGSRWCRGACQYRRGPAYLPPIYGDSGALYGPRAVRQFLGVGGGISNVRAGGPLRVATATAPAPPPKLSNPTARARAWKFVEHGDRHFKNGDYRKAATRYRKAATQAHDVADIYFRQGLAAASMEKYADAVVAVRKGLALKPHWPESGFVLEELFPTADAKRTVFRQLHVHLDAHPNDSDALFMRSLLQYFDDQPEAAEVGMRRVVELTGLGEHARAFLPQTLEAEDVEKLPVVDGPVLEPRE
ncbi:MAG: hypothetical protein ACR2NU_11450 [Aeoliella sp.]